MDWDLQYYRLAFALMGLALAEAKKLINIGLASEVGLNAEAEAFSGLFSTKDFEEGISAFSEKRKPIFIGK